MLCGLAAASLLGATPREAEAGEFDGRWALLQVSMTVAEVPMLGPVKTATTIVSIHELTHEGNRLKGKGQRCSLSIEGERGLLTTTLSKALLEALPEPNIDAQLALVNGRMTFFHMTQTTVLGAKLERPTDPLPGDPADPRVFDQDKDRKPGVTMSIKGMAEGDIHLVQSSWARLDGIYRSDQTFAGVVRHGLTQLILGATVPLLQNPPKNVPIIDGSRFRMGRFPEGGCPEAIELSKTWK